MNSLKILNNRLFKQKYFILSCIFLISAIIIIKLAYFKSQSPVNADLSADIYLDFSSPTLTGSPLIFGGAHTPRLDQQAAWDLLVDVGVTSIRRDFYIDWETPSTYTLENYKNNVNDIQDSRNWKKNYIAENNAVYNEAKKRGIFVIGIVAYIPSWLGINGNHSVPRDWSVYKELVKKSYILHRPFVDMLEIWNEPDLGHFLNVKNSGLSKEEAYLKIFETAVSAIREADVEIDDGRYTPIIGPAISNFRDEYGLVKKLMDSPYSEYLAGFSLHSYGKTEPSWALYEPLLNTRSKNFPVFITEWNQAEIIKPNEYVYTSKAISFTGRKLIDFLRYGVSGANYFATIEHDPNSKNNENKLFGFFKSSGGKIIPLDQTKSWRLLSKTLDLGSGKSNIYRSNTSSTVAVGFKNIKGLYGFATVNELPTKAIKSVRLLNLPFIYKVNVSVFRASTDDDGATLICSAQLPIKKGKVEFQTILPAESVQGVIIEPVKFTASLFLNVLGISGTPDCIIDPYASDKN